MEAAAYVPGEEIGGIVVVVFLLTSLRLTLPNFLDPTGVNARLDVPVECGQELQCRYPFGNSGRLTVCRRPRNYVLVPLVHG
jgi:hypothetical protein